VERAVALPRVVKVPSCPLLGGVGVGGVLVVDFPGKRVNLPKSSYYTTEIISYQAKNPPSNSGIDNNPGY